MKERFIRLPDEGTEERYALTDSDGNVFARIALSFSEGDVLITDLSVAEEDRRNGYGTRLLQEVVELVDEFGLFVSVDAFFPDTETNAGLKEFFGKQSNFDLFTEKTLYRVPAEKRGELKEWKVFASMKSDAVPLSALSKKKLRKFYEKLKAKGSEFFLEPKDLSYEPDLCFAGLEKDEIRTAVFVKKHSPKELELSFLFSDSVNVKKVFSVLAACIRAVDEKYPDAEIFLNAVTPKSVGAADGFFKGEIKPEGICRASWNGMTARDMYGMAAHMV